MHNAIAAVRALLSAVRQWLVDTASKWWRTARPGVHDLWEAFKVDLIDVFATAAKAAVAPTQGPAAP
jgi:hypothetical protein